MFIKNWGINAREMKHSLIFLMIALLQLSLGLPLDGSVKIKAAVDSQLDGSKLDNAPFSQGRLSEQNAEGSQAVSGVNSASEGQPLSGEAEAVAGAPQTQPSGPVVNGEHPVQSSGEAQADSGGAQVVGGTQAGGGAQIATGGAQPAGEAQGAIGSAQVAGGVQFQLSGSVANEAQAVAEVQNQPTVQVAEGTKTAGVPQVQFLRQSAVGTQASDSGQSQISGQTAPQSQNSRPTADVQATGKAQGIDGAKQGVGGAQAYLSGEGNVEAQPQILETSVGESQAVQGEKNGVEGQANERAKAVPEVAVPALSQATAGAAPDNSQALSPGLQQSQEGMQAMRSEPSQASKQSQPQVIGVAMPLNMPTKISE